MKKILVSVISLCLVLFFTGCTISPQSQTGGLAIDNNVVTDTIPAQDERLSLDADYDADYQAAEKKLNNIFLSEGKYKCELIIDASDAYQKNIFYIDGENYRAYGYNNPKSPEVYKILGNVTSNIIGKRQGNEGSSPFCTYLWSIGANNEGIKTEKGISGCKKNYNPPKPFEINDLVNGAFLGVSSELINACVKFDGVIDYSVPSDQEFVDFSELSLDNA